MTLSIVALRKPSASCSNAGPRKYSSIRRRQSFVNQIVNFAMNALARNENLFDERKLLVIVVNFALDERADLFARVLAGGNVREVLHDRRHLAVDAFLDETLWSRA